LKSADREKQAGGPGVWPVLLQGVEMGFLEICVEMMNLSGSNNLTSPWSTVAGFLYLIAALLLALNLKPPRKEDQLF
jgi:hypothetical protein